MAAVCAAHSASPTAGTSCKTDDWEVWAGALLGSLAIGFVGVLPLFLLPIGEDDKPGGSSTSLRAMLGCACGGLLGNSVLHLLPEAYASVGRLQAGRDELYFMGLIPVDLGSHHGFNGDLYIGLWVLLGIMCFIVLEKTVTFFEEDEEDEERGEGAAAAAAASAEPTDGAKVAAGESAKAKGDGGNPPAPAKQAAGAAAGREDEASSAPGRRRMSTNEVTQRVDPAGYLNCLVNTMDNFTHGLAVAGSFCVGTRVGVFTTIAIVIHEVPHEVGDFAILIRSGFSRWQAIAAQFLTSAGGLVGAVFGLVSAGGETASLWILPFTAGGFIYIALVSLIPDLLNDESTTMPWWRDVLHVVAGAALVGYTATLS